MKVGYDFSGGVRGKHYKAYRQGHFVKIEKRDGSTEVQHFAPESIEDSPEDAAREVVETLTATETPHLSRR